MTEKDIREQIQNIINQKDRGEIRYIDAVYDLEQVVKKAQEQVKNIAYEPVLGSVINCPCCNGTDITPNDNKYGNYFCSNCGEYFHG